MNANLGGIVPAVVTPLDENRAINVDAFEQLLDRLYRAGSDGVYLCGSTGEGLLLPQEARESIVEMAVKLSPAGKQIIVHTGAKTLDETLCLTRSASALGVTAVSSLPFSGMQAADLAGFYKAIANVSQVPAIAYYFPGFAGFHLSFEQLEQICTLPGVAGLKFTDYDLYSMSMLVNQGATIFNGRDEVLAAGLLMGAHGGIGSIYNVLPHRFVELFRFASEGEWEKARTLQKQINQVITLLLSFPLLPAIKQVMAWNQIDCGDTLREPHRLTQEQQHQLRQALEPHQDLLQI